MQPQKTTSSHSNLEMKNKVGSVTLPDFKPHYRAVPIQTTMVRTQKETHSSTEQSREPGNEPAPVGSVCSRGGVNTQRGKDRASITARGDWTGARQKMKPDHSITPYTQINSKWIKDLNVTPETIKLPEEALAGELRWLERHPDMPRLWV